MNDRINFAIYIAKRYTERASLNFRTHAGTTTHTVFVTLLTLGVTAGVGALCATLDGVSAPDVTEQEVVQLEGAIQSGEHLVRYGGSADRCPAATQPSTDRDEEPIVLAGTLVGSQLGLPTAADVPGKAGLKDSPSGTALRPSLPMRVRVEGYLWNPDERFRHVFRRGAIEVLSFRPLDEPETYCASISAVKTQTGPAPSFFENQTAGAPVQSTLWSATVTPEIGLQGETALSIAGVGTSPWELDPWSSLGFAVELTFAEPGHYEMRLMFETWVQGHPARWTGGPRFALTVVLLDAMKESAVDVEISQ